LLFRAGALILALGLVEAALDLLRWLSPPVEALLGPPGVGVQHTIPDDRLGLRPNPGVPGTDAHGYRNREVPVSAAVVALGDSQTWGTGVEADEAWPRVLERRTGLPVYSLAFGGYGPAHSLELWDDAVALKPDLIIEAFYAGNDLYDAFSFVHVQGRRSDLASRDGKTLAAIAAAQSVDTLVQRVARTSALSPSRALIGVVGGGSDAPPLMWERTAVYGLVRRVLHEAGWAAAPRLPASDLEALEEAKELARRCGRVAERDDTLTLLTPDYRLVALDLEDPRIREGLRISLRAIGRMRQQATALGTGFLILMLPTKERVFHDFVPEPSPALRRLIENEEQLWSEVKLSLDRQGIDHLDLLPVLRAELDAGRQPYPASRDGHPTASGHEAIAGAVAEVLEKWTDHPVDRSAASVP
jgi:hypothetical protein